MDAQSPKTAAETRRRHYMIVSDTTTDDLGRKVTTFLDEYELVGGPVAFAGAICQAMVTKAEN